MDELFLIAKVKKTEGTKGYLLIESYSDFTDRFVQLSNVFVEFFGNVKEFEVENISILEDKITLKFKGVDSSEDAKIFLKKDILVDKDHLVKLDEDTFFIHDVIGSSVYKAGVLLGNVEDVLILPANDVYLIEDINKKKLLVPAVKDYIKDFNPVEKRLELVPDCDLLYDDEN